MALAYMGLIGAGLTYLIWFRGLAKHGPVAIAPLFFFSPLTTVLLGRLRPTLCGDARGGNDCKPLPEAHRRANVAQSQVRSAIEHIFAAEKHRFGMFVRTVGIRRAALKIGIVNLVYNVSHLVWWEGRTALS